ncbi:flagellar biosynthetic protein FliO [Pantoea deleyi]|uniref:Flagellar protein n=1 Tax=Pantoea deleyi TaxID=470932 RepID=A0A506QGE9_9GAMM|nr:flagellar biosynthetic protein FliO [Pantoea deleyi]ORM85071.1 flagellar biosynthetic protein FliO [Pantoea deleyi]TPV45311.1 flagellar biosynthetic protein FliO [Pantoea deleyi]
MNSQNQTLQTATPHAQAISTGSMLAQVSSVLAVIILLILACAWLARRAGFAPKKVSSQELKLSASVSVGQRERVVIVDTADARLVLGVTAQQITHLHTLPPGQPVSVTPDNRAPQDFRQLLQNLVKRPGKPQ